MGQSLGGGCSGEGQAVGEGLSSTEAIPKGRLRAKSCLWAALPKAGVDRPSPQRGLGGISQCPQKEGKTVWGQAGKGDEAGLGCTTRGHGRAG